jgi:hypothetical protein
MEKEKEKAVELYKKATEQGYDQAPSEALIATCALAIENLDHSGATALANLLMNKASGNISTAFVILEKLRSTYTCVDPSLPEQKAAADSAEQTVQHLSPEGKEADSEEQEDLRHAPRAQLEDNQLSPEEIETQLETLRLALEKQELHQREAEHYRALKLKVNLFLKNLGDVTTDAEHICHLIWEKLLELPFELPLAGACLMLEAMVTVLDHPAETEKYRLPARYSDRLAELMKLLHYVVKNFVKNEDMAERMYDANLPLVINAGFRSLIRCKNGPNCNDPNCQYNHERVKENCTHFLNGRCRNGDNCWYMHDEEQLPVCTHFQEGRCTYGKKCWKLH